MIKTGWVSLLLAGLAFAVWMSCADRPVGWTALLDPNLSQWEIYQSFRFSLDYNGQPPVGADGQILPPVGYNRNEADVFSVENQDGKPVLHITGEIYGCIYTKAEFENYHLSLQVKWGEKKWAPRLDKLKDSGLLYHSIGPCGVDYWRSWMLSQEFQVMEGHMGDYWGIASSAIDVRAYLPEGTLMNTVADVSQPFLPIGPGTDRTGFCLRSANYESPANEWTKLELFCHGDKSIHVVNGHVVMVLRNSRYLESGIAKPLTRGRIQLQSEAAEVFYRDIRIRKIAALPDEYRTLFE